MATPIQIKLALIKFIELFIEQQELIDQAIETGNDNEGVIDESLEHIIRDHESAVEHKVDSIATFIQKLALETEYLKAEADKRYAKAKSLQKLKERLEERCVSIILHHDKPIKGQAFEFSVRKNPKSLHSTLGDVELESLASQNDPFVKTKITYSLDKKAVMNAIESGEISDNRYGIIEQKHRLNIKPAMRYLDYEPKS